MDTVDVLNELLALEAASERSRLRASANFVSWAAAGRVPWFDRLLKDSDEHKAWLVNEILRAGGAPAPVSLGIGTAGHHYLDYQYLLPLLAADTDRLLDAYRRAQRLVAGDPRAAGTLARIIGRYEAQLRELRAAGAPTAST